MTKSGFLATLDVERARWEELLEQISPAWMLQAVVNGWSIKDIIAHVSWYENEMVSMLSSQVFGESELWNMAVDERNRVIFQQSQARSLDDVLAESARIYQEMTREIKKLSDEDLNDPARFAGLPDTLAPWQILASNTYQHYREHMPDIQAWLDRF